MFNIGPEKLVLLLAIALIVLGPSRLPQAARTMAKVLAEFRKVSGAVQSEVSDVLREPRQIFNDALKEPRQMFNEVLKEPRDAFQEHRNTIAGVVGDFRLDTPTPSAETSGVDGHDDDAGIGTTPVTAAAQGGASAPSATGHPLPAPPDDPTLN